jgi:gliding motility-associated-like protein
MRFILIILTFLLPAWVHATHLVGGCIELLWKGGNNYTLVVKVLRDCENGNPRAFFDDPIYIGIFEKGTNRKMSEHQLNFVSIFNDTLKFTGANCANTSTGCTHIGTYSKNIVLNANTYNSNNGYYLSWQRCCRNGIIANILNPGDASMTLYTEIPNLKVLKNSSPRFTNNPNTLLCTNNLFEYNLNFVDNDGDELKYSFIDPINGLLNRDNPSADAALPGPYPNTVYRNGYSNNNGPILGDVPLQIDATTGKIMCNPNAPGVYVASIRVEEFRFGVKIGEIRLELQFTVTNCPNNPPLASVTTLNDQLITADTIEIPVYEKVCFKIRGIDIEDSVFLRIKVGDFDSTIKNRPVFDTLTVGHKLVQTTVCWQGSCEHEGLNAIPFFVNLKDNGCPIPRNVVSKFYVKFKAMPKVPSTDLLCMTLNGFKETTTYYGDSSKLNDPFFKYYLLYRGIDNNNFQIVDTIINKSLRSFFDPNTPNYHQINYVYFMRGVNKCDRLGQTSDTLGTFEQLAFIPQKQYLKFVSVADNKQLEISWPQSPEKDFAKYFLYKAERGKSTFNLLQTFEWVTDTNYVDKAVNVKDTSYCYYLVMLDTCDNLGPLGRISCSMVLKGSAQPFKNNLSFNAYESWSGGVEAHSIFRADPATDYISQVRLVDEYKYTDDRLNTNEGLFYYYVEAKEAITATSGPFFDAKSRSNTIELYQAPVVYIPNAFTANGDGLNDSYKWVPVFVKNLDIQIYNRWGELVFKSDDKLSQWDGTYKGEPAQADVYFYRMNYTGYEGTDKAKSGNFTLLR